MKILCYTNLSSSFSANCALGMEILQKRKRYSLRNVEKAKDYAYMCLTYSRRKGNHKTRMCYGFGSNSRTRSRVRWSVVSGHPAHTPPRLLSRQTPASQKSTQLFSTIFSSQRLTFLYLPHTCRTFKDISIIHAISISSR
jgi:hypothetical protein